MSSGEEARGQPAALALPGSGFGAALAALGNIGRAPRRHSVRAELPWLW